jgi:nucleotide-binding universal stress UspA family protein
MPVRADSSEPANLKWIEVEHEEDWDQVHKIFQPSVERLRSAGLDAAVMIRRGTPKDQVLEEAETWDADCVFLGAKGIRGVDRLLLGSVSSAVAARAHCSVEIVRRLQRS